MLVMVVSLLYWTQTAAGCSGPFVSISEEHNWLLRPGESFKLTCDFTCLTPQHVAQMWKNHSKSLVNITSMLPNVTLVLSISSATKADTGYYSCKTQPPETISPAVLIQISDNLTASTPTTPSTPQCDSTQQHSSAAGMQGQMWYWTLLGKTALLLLSLAFLAVKYNRG